MGQKTVEALKRKLQAKEQELVNAISRSVQDIRQPDDLDTQDLADLAFSSYSKEERFQQSSHDREMLLLVRAALRRADENAFGLCVACGAPVDKKRLEAMPWAGHCVECQELQEKGLLPL